MRESIVGGRVNRPLTPTRPTPPYTRPTPPYTRPSPPYTRSTPPYTRPTCGAT